MREFLEGPLGPVNVDLGCESMADEKNSVTEIGCGLWTMNERDATLHSVGPSARIGRPAREGASLRRAFSCAAVGASLSKFHANGTGLRPAAFGVVIALCV